ncbi:5758_t:CDS:1, partial [Gigaspora rosea]
ESLLEAFIYRILTVQDREEATACLLNFCIMYGSLIVLHSDNGSEFVRRVIKETLSPWPTIKFVNGRPRNPCCQGIVEKGNGILQSKLGFWMEETGRSDW